MFRNMMNPTRPIIVSFDLVIIKKRMCYPINNSICSRSWRKFPDLGTDLTYFENIFIFLGTT